MIKKILSTIIEKITLFFFKLDNTKIITDPNSNIAVTSLVGHKFLYMYLIAIKSFCKYSGIVPYIVVYDDGTLTKKDKKKLLSLGIAIKQQYKLLPEKYPYLVEYTKKQVMLRRVYEPALTLKQDIIIQLDSDIIFMKNFEEYKSLIFENDVVCIRDLNELPFVKFNEEFFPMPKYLNAGFMKYEKRFIDLDKLEYFLSKLPEQEQFWELDQTCFNYLFKDKKILLLPNKSFSAYKPLRFFKGIHFVKQHRFINFAYLLCYWQFKRNK